MLADLDRDGKLDFVLGRQGDPATVYWFRYQGPDPWSKHILGQNSTSTVGAAALDVDRDGWPDIVCSGVWYRNPQKPREQEFTRYVFDPVGGGAHDVITTDVDGDLDICSKAWGPLAWNANDGKMHVDYLENLLIEGKSR